MKSPIGPLHRDVDGLLMVGRNISMIFIAHSSYRVTGDSVPMGEAAGIVAALAARSAACPTSLPGTRFESSAALTAPGDAAARPYSPELRRLGDL